MIVVLIGGKKRHGKDTHAKSLQSKLKAQGKKVTLEHFATPIKSILIESGIVTGLEENKALERPLFQIFGNDVMKKWFGNTVWADSMKHVLARLEEEGYDAVIIPDFRYPCEVEVLRRSWVVRTFRVIRPNLPEDPDTHSSENSLDDFTFDEYFSAENEGDIDLNARVMLGKL